MGAHLNFLSPNRVVPRLCSTRRSTLIHKTSSAAMNSEVGPPQKKKRRNPSHPSFLSLPNVIVVNCLARISRSYYPKLSLVCKTFRFIILSKLSLARSHLKTNENVLHICLQLPTHPLPSWFSLWIKPDQTLTNDIGKKKKSTGNTLLVPTPCSYYPHVPKFTVKVGAEKYGLSQKNAPSAVLRICSKETNREIRLWRKGPNMTIARERAVAGVVDGKIYVMGGCGADESMKWAEVFDPKTQTWESLPDPGAEIRHSSIKTIEVIHSKLYLRNNEKKDYVYDPRSNKWKDVEKPHVKFLVKKVWYRCGLENFLWYDAKSNVWRVVRGLATLNRNCRGSVIEMAKYRGKLLVLWDKFVHPGRRDHKYIWCAVIAVEKRNDGEVCGKIEWANIVLKVPSSYVFLRRL